MKGNKWVILLIHAVIFTVLLKVINDYLNDCRKKEKFADTGDIPVWMKAVGTFFAIIALIASLFLQGGGGGGSSSMPESTNVKNPNVKLNQPIANNTPKNNLNNTPKNNPNNTPKNKPNNTPNKPNNKLNNQK